METSMQRMVRLVREVTKKEEHQIKKFLIEHIHREPHEAIQLTLQDIFNEEDQENKIQLANDIETMAEIFPEASEDMIRQVLYNNRNQPNYLSNVAKELLTTNGVQATSFTLVPLPSFQNQHEIAPLTIPYNPVDTELPSYLHFNDESGPSQPYEPSDSVHFVHVLGGESSSDDSESDAQEGLSEFEKNAFNILKRQFPTVSSEFLRRKLTYTQCNSMQSLGKLIKDESFMVEESSTSTKPLTRSARNHRRKIRTLAETGFDDFPTYFKKRRIEKNEPELVTENNSSLSNQEMIELCTLKFDVIKFSDAFADLETHFSVNHGKAWGDKKSYDYAVTSLLNLYYNVGEEDIDRCIFGSSCFMEACEKLDKCKRLENNPRVAFSLPEMKSNISLLQEVAFKTHYKEIMDYLLLRKNRELKLTEARNAGILVKCNCCFDKEIFPEDMYECEKGCKFCKLCIKKSVEVAFGYGKLQFVCINFCPGHFSSDTLKEIMSPEIFKKICFKKEMRELQESGVENLETCPSCDYVKVMEGDEEVFECLNSDCMRRSCRLCKEPYHAPYRCSQVEKDENVKARTYIEEKMTLAILRKCRVCGRRFMKSSGCNTVKCICGETMCYICNEYNCMCNTRLRNSSTDEEKVMTAGRLAKEEVGENLKIDPLADVQDYFQSIRQADSADFLPNIQFHTTTVDTIPFFNITRSSPSIHPSRYLSTRGDNRTIFIPASNSSDTEEPQDSMNSTNNSDFTKGG